MYWLHEKIRQLRELPYCAVQALLVRRSPVMSCDGINVISAKPYAANPELFCKVVRSSLELIKTIDPRRYCRVRSHIRWVVNMQMPGWAVYRSLCRTCSMNIEDADIEKNEVYTREVVACLLVFIATRAVVASRCIAQSRRTQERVTQLCRKEVARFARARMTTFGWHEVVGR